MVIRLFDDPTTSTAGPVMCPECRGRGEVELVDTAEQDENGVWTIDTPLCGRCSGTGLVTAGGDAS